MSKRFLILCLLMSTGSICVGQEHSQQNAPRQMQTETEIRFNGMVDRIKALDESTLRVFLQIQSATSLWNRKTKSGAEQAETLAAEAMANLQAHESEIPTLYAGPRREHSFKRDQNSSHLRDHDSGSAPSRQRHNLL